MAAVAQEDKAQQRLNEQRQLGQSQRMIEKVSSSGGNFITHREQVMLMANGILLTVAAGTNKGHSGVDHAHLA